MNRRSAYDKSSTVTDDAHMSRALELARRGTALAHPNPMVGAVLVQVWELVSISAIVVCWPVESWKVPKLSSVPDGMA